MKFPTLNNNQVAVLMADGHTGIILNQNREYYNNTLLDNNEYSIFESIEQALNFIKETSALNNKIEFIVYNHNEEVIKFIESAI